eukprot:6501296-Prymnesium_polylepis.1
MFNLIDICVAGRTSFWYALSHQLSPVTQSPRTPPTRPNHLAYSFSPHRCIAGANRQRQRQFVAPHRR